ncbi:MAG: hypothetical protein ACRDG3_05560 [Tepidiformaceae bacterium]
MRTHVDDPSVGIGPVAKTIYRRILTSADSAQVQLWFDASLLARYREAGYQVKRTNTVGRVKAPTWAIDFGIGAEATTIHASIADLLRLPEAERQHWAMYVAEAGLSENFLKMMLHAGSCIDDGDTRDW